MAFSNDLFWDNVSGDHERMVKSASLVHAKVAAATWWPFLSHAESETDFENRLSLVSNKIESSVGTDLYDEVVSSLRDDYRAVYEASTKTASAPEPSLHVVDEDDLSRTAVFHEQYGEVSRPQLAAYRKHNVPPALHDELAGYFGSENHGAITNYVNATGPHQYGEDAYRKGLGYGSVYRHQPSASGHLRELEEGSGGWGHFGSKEAAWYNKDDEDYDAEKVASWDKGTEWMRSAEEATRHSRNPAYSRDQDGRTQPHRRASKEAAEHNPYVTGERSMCKTCNGWGSYGGDHAKAKNSTKCEGCDGKGYRENKKTATNYQPDPNAAWRYYAPYQNIEGAGQLNNGALQDSDGFPIDLAQGEYDAAQQRMQFQLTPGQWTQHDGMPERPMPQGVARGYQPVAAVDYRKMIGGSTDEEKPLSAHYNEVPEIRGTSRTKGTFDGPTGREIADAEKLKVQRKSSVRVDADGFLVEALVDPVPGATQRVNPYYFNDDAAMGANDGFPVDPGPEPLESRSDTYGEVAPTPSAGSTQGTSDGKGYSRSHPGESPDFSQGAGERNAGRHSAPNDGYSYDGEGYPESDDVHKVLAQYRIHPLIHDPHALVHGILGMEPRNRHSQEYMDAYNRGAKITSTSARFDGIDPDDYPSPADLGEMKKWDDERRRKEGPVDLNDGNPWSARPSHWSAPSPDEHPHDPPAVRDFLNPKRAYDEYDKAAEDDDAKFDRHMEWQHLSGEHGFEPHHDCYMCKDQHHTAGTDGRIVDHCPGCEKPRRVHATPHGDEVRHLHNDHVRCFGDRTARKRDAALNNGGNIDGHERPLTFQEGLEYNGQYGVHTAEGQLSNGSVHTADYLGRPDAQNPTGRGADEYQARNWDAYSRQRPMQTPEDRGVNTPVLGREPLRTRDVNTPTPGLKGSPAGRDGEDEEEDE